MFISYNSLKRCCLFTQPPETHQLTIFVEVHGSWEIWAFFCTCTYFFRKAWLYAEALCLCCRLRLSQPLIVTASDCHSLWLSTSAMLYLWSRVDIHYLVYCIYSSPKMQYIRWWIMLPGIQCILEKRKATQSWRFWSAGLVKELGQWPFLSVYNFVGDPGEGVWMSQKLLCATINVLQHPSAGGREQP